MFQFETLELHNFRCFEDLSLSLESNVTVLFAENGGGKSALLSALAAGMALFQPRSPKQLKLDLLRDTRKYVIDGARRESAAMCSMTWSANANGVQIEWSIFGKAASGRVTRDIRELQSAFEEIRQPGRRWPLFCWYGTNRMLHEVNRRRPRITGDRWDGYASSLEPSITDGPLLEWFEREILGDLVRHRNNEAERRLDEGVLKAMIRATPNLLEAWYDPIERAPVFRFDNGQIAAWNELSDGFHVFIALIGDIARRSIMLNDMDGAAAPDRIEGTVLIDEIDMHLHPRWQRIVLGGLRSAFPKLQFVVSTHSPQLLSSAENRQVRQLADWTIVDQTIFVEGRDSNAILREHMHTTDRDDEGIVLLQTLHDAIDHENWQQAREVYDALLKKWGDLDPDLIRAKGMLEWERNADA